MNSVLNWLKARAKEPSTLAGLAVIASIFLPHSAGTIGQVTQAISLIVGGGLVATPNQPSN